MIQFKIKVFEPDSRGKEHIIDIKDNLSRLEATKFIESIKAEPKPYKMQKGKVYYEMNC